MCRERDSNWHLHLESYKSMLAYDKVFDYYKYFSWGIIYLADMEMPPQDYPEDYVKILEGKHAVARAKNDSCFNIVATDMVLEQSLNRDSKTKGENG